MSPAVEFWITLILGPFGIHRFAKGQIGMGVLYLCTGGLFFIGWIADTVKAGRLYMKAASYSNALNHKPSHLVPVTAPGLNMNSDEVCVYFGGAQYAITKNRVAGHVHERGGASVRIVPGVLVGRSTGVTRTVRENITERYPGMLYITNQRVVFAGDKGAFSKPLSAVTTMSVNPNGIELQFGSTFYSLLVPDSARCINILEGAINKMPILNE